MPKYLALHVVAIAGLVVAVTFLIFQSRALTIRLQALESERAPERVGKQALEVSAHPPQKESREAEDELTPALVEGTNRGLGNLNSPPPSATAPVVREEAALTPAQEQAVARQIDRILAEKYGHLPTSSKAEDLEKILERELNLTASQKERIAELLKNKREESSTIFKGGNPFSGKALQKAMELAAKYDQLIKNELDATQQAKYDRLKKDGRIKDGISIQIEAKDEE